MRGELLRFQGRTRTPARCGLEGRMLDAGVLFFVCGPQKKSEKKLVYSDFYRVNVLEYLTFEKKIPIFFEFLFFTRY